MEFYEMLKRVGRGHHGTAWLVRDSRDQRLYCLKTINLQSYDESERTQAAGEVNLLRSLDHPCIVRYREHFLNAEGSLCIVMTFCEGGDLASAIRAQKELGEHFAEASVLEWFAQLALALGHTHERRILHRDLKTQNVFLTRTQLVKLGDYGIARVLDGCQSHAQTVVGTPFYMSPEVCQNRPYSYSSDVWALGCVLYELLALRQAWDGSNLLGLVYKIVQQTYEPPPEHYSPELRGLLAAMLAKDPERRPTVAQILQLPLVRRAVQAIADREPTLPAQPPQQAVPLAHAPAQPAPAGHSPGGAQQPSQQLGGSPMRMPLGGSALAHTPVASSASALGVAARVRRPHSGSPGSGGAGGTRRAGCGCEGESALGAGGGAAQHSPLGRAASASASGPGGWAADSPCRPVRCSAAAGGAQWRAGGGRGAEAEAEAEGPRAHEGPGAHAERGGEPERAEARDSAARGSAGLTPAQRMLARKIAAADEAASQLAAAAAVQRRSHDAAARRGRLQFEPSAARAAAAVAAEGQPGGARQPQPQPSWAEAAARPRPDGTPPAQPQPPSAASPPSPPQPPPAALPLSRAEGRPSHERRALEQQTQQQTQAEAEAYGQEDFESDSEREASDPEPGPRALAAPPRPAAGPEPRGGAVREQRQERELAELAQLQLEEARASQREDEARLSRLAARQVSRGAGPAAAACQPQSLPASSASVAGAPPPTALPGAFSPDEALLPPHNGFEPRHSASERADALRSRCSEALGPAFSAVYELLRSHHARQDGSDVRPALVALVGRDRLAECFGVDQLIFQELLSTATATDRKSRAQHGEPGGGDRRSSLSR